jgi:(S)-2-hydroxyglutarate dehydrogenase
MAIAADPPPRECDVAVVGAGILGLAVARELLARRPGARLCVLEREPVPAFHQTGHSSGVLHAGIYYEPGSLKARMCVRGAAMLRDYCAERELALEPSGKLIVAADEDELGRLAELERRGAANQVPDLRRVAADEIAEIEPEARGLAALHSPATALVDFAAIARAFADDVDAAGGTVHTGCAVHGMDAGGRSVGLRHSQGTTSSEVAVLCAGLWADRLAVAGGAPADPRVVPFRGAYLAVDGPPPVRGNVYPVPDPALPFLGAHVTRGLAGKVTIGPSALIAPARDAYRLSRLRGRDLAETLAWPGTWRLALRHRRAAAVELRRAASRRAFAADAARLVPVLRERRLRRGPTGVRAQALARDGTLVDDFVLHLTERAVHVRNAPSPAATSAPALAELIADELDAAA